MMSGLHSMKTGKLLWPVYGKESDKIDEDLGELIEDDEDLSSKAMHLQENAVSM